MSATKNYRIVKVIDNFNQYLTGFHTLDMDDTVILEGTQDGQRVTTGVLVSELLTRDEYSELGTPSQRLNLLKAKSRAFLSVKAYRSQDNSSCRLQPNDKVTVTRWEGGSTTPTILEVSADQFVNWDGFFVFGTPHQRLDLIRTMSGNKTCGKNWSEIPMLRYFIQGDNYPTTITDGQVISSDPPTSGLIKRELQRNEEIQGITNTPQPTHGILNLHRKIIFNKVHRERSTIISRATIQFQGPNDKDGHGPDAFQIELEQESLSNKVSLTVTNTKNGKFLGKVVVQEDELINNGLDICVIEEDGSTPLSPIATRYFWELVKRQYGVER
ncbi:MAG: hypothetical protein U1F66_05675 [bacterium]